MKGWLVLGVISVLFSTALGIDVEFVSMGEYCDETNKCEDRSDLHCLQGTCKCLALLQYSDETNKCERNALGELVLPTESTTVELLKDEEISDKIRPDRSVAKLVMISSEGSSTQGPPAVEPLKDEEISDEMKPDGSSAELGISSEGNSTKDPPAVEPVNSEEKISEFDDMNWNWDDMGIWDITSTPECRSDGDCKERGMRCDVHKGTCTCTGVEGRCQRGDPCSLPAQCHPLTCVRVEGAGQCDCYEGSYWDVELKECLPYATQALNWTCRKDRQCLGELSVCSKGSGQCQLNGSLDGEKDIPEPLIESGAVRLGILRDEEPSGATLSFVVVGAVLAATLLITLGLVLLRRYRRRAGSFTFDP